MNTNRKNTEMIICPQIYGGIISISYVTVSCFITAQIKTVSSSGSKLIMSCVTLKCIPPGSGAVNEHVRDT